MIPGAARRPTRTPAWCLALLLASLAACSSEDESTAPEQGGALTVAVDARIELLAVVQHFTPWAAVRHTRYDFSYLDDVDQYFGAHSTHAATVVSQQLIDSGFSYDAPPTFVLHLGPPPELEPLSPYSDYLVTRAGGAAPLDEFAQTLRDFARDTDFAGFFVGHLGLYAQIKQTITSTIGDTDYVSLLEDYYGERKHSYNITPAPLFHAGGYGPQIAGPAGWDVYDVAGPLGVEADVPHFGDEAYFEYILLHEFSHSFVNPITDWHRSAIAASSSLFDPIEQQMTDMAYPNWQTCVNEHLVRTNVARFALQLAGEQAKQQILTQEQAAGFIYIDELDELMQQYEDNRASYPTYEIFYPEIIALFDELAAAGP